MIYNTWKYRSTENETRTENLNTTFNLIYHIVLIHNHKNIIGKILNETLFVKQCDRMLWNGVSKIFLSTITMANGHFRITNRIGNYAIAYSVV